MIYTIQIEIKDQPRSEHEDPFVLARLWDRDSPTDTRYKVYINDSRSYRQAVKTAVSNTIEEWMDENLWHATNY